VKVFVSYCTRDVEAWDIIQATRDHLTAAGHEVFLDVLVLLPGDQWRPKIDMELGECGAAILFLSDQALKSSWVRKEVNVLAWRRALGGEVCIIPVLLGGLEREEVVRAGFSELETLEYETVSPADSADAAAQKILARFASGPPDSRANDKMASWATRVAEYLADVKDAASLRSAAVALGIPDADVSQVTLPIDGRKFFAYQMLQHERSGKLVPAIAAFAHKVHPDQLLRLIDEVRPTWVDPAAAWLILQPPGQASHKLFLLNASAQTTGKQYIDRAHCCALTGFEVQYAGGRVGENPEIELPPQYEEALGALYGWLPSFPKTEREDDDTLYFMVVEPEPRRFRETLAVVRRMQEKFPQLFVILLTGSDGLAQLDTDEESLTDCVPLEPVLAAGAEESGLGVGDRLNRLWLKASGHR
jgi:hypothetical protein